MRLYTDAMAEVSKTEDEKKEVEEKVRLLAEKVESLEADLEKAKSGESHAMRLLTSRRACGLRLNRPAYSRQTSFRLEDAFPCRA